MFRGKWAFCSDHVGIACSLLCLIHCLALPLIVLAFPTLNFFEDEAIHTGLLMVILPVALWSFCRCRKGFPWPLLLGTLGVLTLGAGLVLELLELAEEHHQVALNILGSVLLLAGHTLNIKSKFCH